MSKSHQSPNKNSSPQSRPSTLALHNKCVAVLKNINLSRYFMDDLPQEEERMIDFLRIEIDWFDCALDILGGIEEMSPYDEGTKERAMRLIQRHCSSQHQSS